MDVSIIIVNWNTCDILRDCLRSIYQQTENLAFEVIVIDNASGDDSVGMVRRDFPDVNLIENQKNEGFATANNQGLTLARGRYCLLLNSDTVVLDNAVARSVVFADQHPNAAVVGCRVLNPDNTLQPTCFMFPSLLNMVLSSTYLYKLFPQSRFFARERMTWWDRNDIREVEVVTGCFMLVRREAIDKVGLLDESFFMYGEETDWCYRFKQAGWQRLFTPNAEIIHLGGQSSKLNSEKMYIQLRMSILHFIRKHYSHPIVVIANMLVIVFLALRIPYWFLAAVFRSGDRSECYRRVQVYYRGIRKILSC